MFRATKTTSQKAFALEMSAWLMMSSIFASINCRSYFYIQNVLNKQIQGVRKFFCLMWEAVGGQNNKKRWRKWKEQLEMGAKKWCVNISSDNRNSFQLWNFSLKTLLTTEFPQCFKEWKSRSLLKEIEIFPLLCCVNILAEI